MLLDNTIPTPLPRYKEATLTQPMEDTDRAPERSDNRLLPPSDEGRDPGEPIFNRMPIGVAVLIGLILVMHIVGLLIGPERLAHMRQSFALYPIQIWSDLGNGILLAPIIALVASQFLHGGTLHLVMNLAMLLQAGPIAEFGLNRHKDEAVRFMIFFILCGIGGGLMFCWINPNSPTSAIGASGAISGVFAGFLWAAIGLARPGQAMLRPVLASGAVFLLINVGLAWIGRVTNFMPIAWECHLGGFISGLILYPVFVRMGRKRQLT
jgi:membrane associated rhomboid family serine protease